jgi:hypothetical protein
MAGKKTDTIQVERVCANGFVDVEFINGKARVATFEQIGVAHSSAVLNYPEIEDLIGALKRVLRKVRKAEG